jgi:hypothetical protein
LANYDNAAVVPSRDFESFAPITQELILLIAQGSKISACKTENPSLIRLAENLRNDEAIIAAANQLLENQPLFWSTHDFLMIIRDNCLRPYHEESYLHLMRVLAIFRENKKFWLAGKFDALNRVAVEDGVFPEKISFTEDEWLCLEWAHAFHDFVRWHMQYLFGIRAVNLQLPKGNHYILMPDGFTIWEKCLMSPSL